MSSPRWVEKSGRTVEEALQAALDELGVGRDRVDVEVLDEPNRGLWGWIGGKLARIRVTVRDGSESRVGGEGAAGPGQQGGEPGEGRDVAPVEAGAASRAGEERAGQAVAGEGAAQPAQLDAAALEAIRRKVERGKEFLRELVRRMGPGGHVETRRVEADLYLLNVVTQEPARLIGRHGDTLDAVQYLVNLAANRHGEGPWVRFVVDAGDYRRRREAALRALAQRVARQVRRTGKSVSLEPMNPLERRVIHLALRDDPAVTTRSEGEEPNRRVVVHPRHPEGAQQAPPAGPPRRRRPGAGSRGGG